MFNYGELLLIYNGLKKLPKEAFITHKEGLVEFEPVSVSELKEKVKRLGEEIEKTQG